MGVVGIDLQLLAKGTFSLLEEEGKGRTGVIDERCFDDLLSNLNLIRGSGRFGIFRFCSGKESLELMTMASR